MSVNFDKLAKVLNEANTLISALEKDLDATTPSDMTQLLTFFSDLKAVNARMKTTQKSLSRVFERANKGLVPEAFEKLGQDNIRIPELRRSFYPLVKYSASIKDKDKGYAWLNEVGLSALITQTVNAGTLSNALVHLLEDEGIEPHPDVIAFKSYTLTGSSAYTPKN